MAQEKKSQEITQFDPDWERKVDERIQKALYRPVPNKGRKKTKKPRHYQYDPMAMLDMLEYKERPTTLSFDLLKRMANRDSVVASIINTRINQASRFCYPCRTREDRIGYRLRPVDPKQEISNEMKAQIQELETYLHNCGRSDPSEVRDDFPAFLKKIIRDRLVYDAVAVEIVSDFTGLPAAFYAVDAATIRYAIPKDKDKFRTSVRREDMFFTQYIQGKKVAEFNYDEMAYGVFYPKTDINAFGYGFSELEQLIRIITAHLWAEEYNSKFFSQGSLPKGLLNFKGGNMTKPKLEAFRRAWQAQVAGLTGAWRIPVVSSPELQWVDMHHSNQDMEFGQWLDYLVNIICSVYCIDPAEINFPSRGGTGDSHEKPLFDNSFQSKLQMSKDKGLYPLLDYIAHFINKNIIWKINPDLVFVFEGLDKKMGMARLEAQEKEVKIYKTINDIRKEEELEPIDGGDILLDGTYITYITQKDQLALQVRQSELQLKNQVVALKMQILNAMQLERTLQGTSPDNFDLSDDESSELDALMNDIFDDKDPTLNKMEKEIDEGFDSEETELPEDMTEEADERVEEMEEDADERVEEMKDRE